MKRNRWRQLLTIVLPAVALYVAALFLPAADLRGQTSSGAGMLFLGALGFLFGLPATLAWLLNPCFVVALLVLRSGASRSAFWLAIAGLLLGYLFTMSAESLFSLPVDEAGGRANIARVHLGFWLWLAAPALVAAGAGVEIRRQAVAADG